MGSRLAGKKIGTVRPCRLQSSVSPVQTSPQGSTPSLPFLHENGNIYFCNIYPIIVDAVKNGPLNPIQVSSPNSVDSFHVVLKARGIILLCSFGDFVILRGGLPRGHFTGNGLFFYVEKKSEQKNKTFTRLLWKSKDIFWRDWGERKGYRTSYLWLGILGIKSETSEISDADML